MTYGDTKYSYNTHHSYYTDDHFLIISVCDFRFLHPDFGF
jgi:hypothetical protein